MKGFWRCSWFKLQLTMVFAATLVINHNFSLCSSLNTEGLALLKFRDRIEKDHFGVLSGWNNDGEGADLSPCSWFGVECSDGKVIVLNLRDLCLGGTLAPELGKLKNVKSIILRNNSFYGRIPQEFGDLEDLEVLDLGYNNFTGSFPSDLGDNLSLSILLLDNNEFLDTLSPEVSDLKTVSEFQVSEDQLTSSRNGANCNSKSGSWNIIQSVATTKRKLLQFSPSDLRLSSISFSPSTAPSISESPSPSPSPVFQPSPISPPIKSTHHISRTKCNSHFSPFTHFNPNLHNP